MRLDHVAFRVPDRDKAIRFFTDAFGYKFQEEFEIYFDDARTDRALCVALEPPERVGSVPFAMTCPDSECVYHMAPEIFISEGTPGSIVWNWVQSRGGFGGVHHFAYQVEDVEAKMREWTAKGWGNFSTDKPLSCPGVTQVFSQPNCTGVIFEFIKRDRLGFCWDNVKSLMQSVAELDRRIP